MLGRSMVRLRKPMPHDMRQPGRTDRMPCGVRDGMHLPSGICAGPSIWLQARVFLRNSILLPRLNGTLPCMCGGRSSRALLRSQLQHPRVRRCRQVHASL